MKDTLVIALEMLESAKDIIIIVHPLLRVNEISILQKAIAYLPKDNPVILDTERGDNGSTAVAYAQTILKALNPEALTMTSFYEIRCFRILPGRLRAGSFSSL